MLPRGGEEPERAPKDTFSKSFAIKESREMGVVEAAMRLRDYFLMMRIKLQYGISLVAQRLRLRAPNAEGLGSIPGWGTRSHVHAATKSSHATTKELASHN